MRTIDSLSQSMRLSKIYASIKYEDLTQKDIEVLKSFNILNGYGGA